MIIFDTRPSMFTSLKILFLVVFAVTVNAQKNFGSNCRNVNCPSSMQCFGLYEPCKGGLVEGSTCGFYATCIDPNGEVNHSEPKRVASTSNAGSDDAKPNGSDVVLPSKSSSNIGSLYPNLPQPDQPSPSGPQGGYNPQNPQGGYYPPNQGGGYYPQNPQGGYYPPNPQGGYYPPNPQGGYYPPNPNNPPASDSKGSKKEGESGLGSILNFFSGGNRGSSGNSGGGPDLGSLLSVLGRGGSPSSNSGSGSGGLDFSSLLNTFTGSGGNQNNRNDNRNPTGPVGPNSPYGGSSGQNPNQSQDSGPGFLQTLGNFATSPLGQQLIANALSNRNNNNENAQQNRRYGGLFSENTSGTTNASGATSRGYPTQAP